MSKITELASGQITKSDRIIVILVEPEGMPSSVIIPLAAGPQRAQPGRASSGRRGGLSRPCARRGSVPDAG